MWFEFLLVISINIALFFSVSVIRKKRFPVIIYMAIIFVEELRFLNNCDGARQILSLINMHNSEYDRTNCETLDNLCSDLHNRRNYFFLSARQDNNLYSQINYKLQWYREVTTEKNT